ncbi:MAG: prepilin-type N-terminal cleavage/methylation domain-containing protein [Planctomycetota bacterium]
MNFELRTSFSQRALTLVELLIVIVVIGILVSAILVASSGFINKGRSNNTQSVLQIVADAVEEFKREQTAKPTITRARQPKLVPPPLTVNYSDRYGAYPPDELEVFTLAGLPGSGPPPAVRTLAAGGAVIVPAPTPSWGAMRFYKDGDQAANALENRDQAAMILAIETLSESGSAILDRIPDRNRTVGALQADGTPALFLDRTGGATGAWDPNDHQIRLIIDDWGNPISYFSERDWQDPSVNPSFMPIPSRNHDTWNRSSTEIIRLNGGQPVIFSYGPNGKDQLTKDAMGATGLVSLVYDFSGGAAHDHIINEPYNDDNVYSNPALKEKLAKGIKPQ